MQIIKGKCLPKFNILIMFNKRIIQQSFLLPKCTCNNVIFATCKKQTNKKPTKNQKQIKTKQKKNKTVITIYVFVNMNNFRYSLFQCLWLYVQIVNKSKLLILKKWTLIGHSKIKISTMYIKANQTQKIPKFIKYEIFPELSFRVLCLIDNVSRKSILFIFFIYSDPKTFNFLH